MLTMHKTGEMGRNARREGSNWEHRVESKEPVTKRSSGGWEVGFCHSETPLHREGSELAQGKGVLRNKHKFED